jgi:RNA recognition motif-containing protein
MADPYQASLAHLHLNHVDLFGKPITIIPSKHAAVSLPHPSLQKGSNLARDYTNSPLHRFKYNRSKNFRHICAPGSVLHISNLAEEVTADELRSQFGPKVIAVQFFKTDRRMAFVRMSSTGEAVNALVRLHNTKIGSKPIKVSFSPKKPAQIEDDSKSGEVSRQTSSSDQTSTSKSRTQTSSSSASSSSSSTSTRTSSVPTASTRSTTTSSRPTSVPTAVGSSRSAPKTVTSQQPSQSRIPLSQSSHPPQNRVVAPGPSGQQGRSGGTAVRSAQPYQSQYSQEYQSYGGYNYGGYRDHKQQG